MKKRLPMSVWKVEYVERGRREFGAPLFSTDTIIAPSFTDAVVKAERERRRFRRAVKIRSIVCVESLTA